MSTDKLAIAQATLRLRPALILLGLFGFFISAFSASGVLLGEAYAETGKEAGEVRTVESAGFASVMGRDVALARDGAVDDALRKAVEQAVGTMVSAETMVENYQVLKDSVYTKSAGYVKDYSVLDESMVGNMVRVTVRATVAVGDLKNDLDAIGILYGRAEMPRVLFMIAEQNIGEKHLIFWWWGRREYRGETVDMSVAETALKKAFVEKGFNVVDASGSAHTFEVDNAFRVADLTDRGARSIGKDLNAEIVVKGKAFAREGPRTKGSPVGVYMADVTAQAIRVDTGEVLGSAAGRGTSRHISEVTGGNEALSRASAELADKLTGQILGKWTAGNMVTIRIKGVTDYKKIVELKDAIKRRVRGVKAVYQRGFDGAEAVLELNTKVSAQKIADDMSKLPGLDIEVTGTTPNTIDVIIRERPL